MDSTLIGSVREMVAAFQGTPHSQRCRRRRKQPCSAISAATQTLEPRILLDIQLQFDYRYDTNNFFGTAERRAALEYAGKLVTSRLDDTFSPITPSGTDTWTAKFKNPQTGMDAEIKNLSVSTATILIFVGARDLPGSALGQGGPGGYSASGSSAWLDTVKKRSESGVSNNTDVAPWGGSIAFDSPTKWHYGKTTAGLDGDEADFISVATHEIMHVMGLFTSGSAKALITSNNFQGSRAKAAYGNKAVPMQSGNEHFKDGTKSLEGSRYFEVVMDSSSTSGSRFLPTSLDLAAMDDIGWELSSTKDDLLYQGVTKHTSTFSISPPPIKTEIAFAASLGTPSSSSQTADVDFYRVYYDQNTKLGVVVDPSRTTYKTNTYLKLFDGNGTVLASANQGLIGAKDFINYNVPRSDYYWIGVSTYENRSFTAFTTSGRPLGMAGNYLITISAVNQLTSAGVNIAESTASSPFLHMSHDSAGDEMAAPHDEMYYAQVVASINAVAEPALRRRRNSETGIEGEYSFMLRL